VKTLTAELVVVGAGLAGVAAALRGRELGLNVLLIEQSADPSGWSNSRMSGARYHAAGMHPATAPEKIAARVRQETEGFASGALTESWASNCGRSYAWLRARGVRFVTLRDVPVIAPIRPNRRGEVWAGYGADVAIRQLLARFVNSGGTRRANLRAVELRMSGRKICGLVAKASAGAPDITVESPNVVLADGGFQSNNELLRSYANVPRPEALLQRGAATGVGDGLTMALNAGGSLLSGEALYAHLVHRDAKTRPDLLHYPMLDALAAASTVVDGHGRRFCDERLGGIAIANRLARIAAPESGWVVFDKHVWLTAGRQAQVVPPNPNLLVAGARIEVAGSVASLATQMRVPADALQDSLDTRAAEDGHQAGLTAHPLRLFAVPLAVGLTFTMGGIAVGPNGAVLNPDGDPFAGLYAAGTTAGGLSGGPKPAYVGGISIAATLGLLAAEAAATPASVTTT
jgi:fumarate reductase flavoprotein subunit